MFFPRGVYKYLWLGGVTVKILCLCLPEVRKVMASRREFAVCEIQIPVKGDCEALCVPSYVYKSVPGHLYSLCVLLFSWRISPRLPLFYMMAIY